MGNDNVGQTFLDGAKTGAITGAFVGGIHVFARDMWNKRNGGTPDSKPSRESGFVLQSKDRSIFHGGSLVYKHPDGREGVYYPDSGLKDLRPRYRASGNFGKNDVPHAFRDVAPYMLFGNEALDFSTIFDRLKITLEWYRSR